MHQTLNTNYMKQEIKHYEAPAMEVLEVSVEQSFATSPAYNYNGFDGEEQWD